MHPSLKLSSLARLPATLKASALAAARGSLRDFDSFIRFLASDPRFEKKYLPQLICVLYVALDPTPISAFLADETPSAVDKDAFAEVVARALRAITSLNLWTERRLELPSHQKTSPAVFGDLWPRMWVWMQFLDTFDGSGLVTLPSWSTVHHYQTLSAAIDLARQSTLLTRQILDTPHFFDFLGEAWARLVRWPNELLPLEHRLRGLRHLSEMIYMDLDSLANSYNRFDELCECAGGHRSIARLCVSTIKLFFPTTSAQYPDGAYRMLHGLISFLALPAARDWPLRTALYQEDFSTHFTIAVRALLANMDDPRPGEASKAKGIIDLCFSMLCIGLALHITFRDDPFVEGLKAGYLFATYSYLRHVAPDTAVDFIEALKGRLMFFSTSRNVLRQLRRDKAELTNMVDTSQFSSELAAQTWHDVLTFIRGRLERFEEYHDLLLHGCDNFACGRLHAKTNVARCGRCSQVQYCSRACQRIDWTQRHRAHCLRSAAARGQRHIYGRQRHLVLDASFMRWLMNSDHSAQEETIALLFLRFFALHRSDDTLPYVLFNWMEGPELGRLCRVTVEPLTKTPKLEELYAEDIDRARNSRGRFQLHFFVSGGDFVPCPMYSTSSLLYEGLEAIAARIPADEAQDMDMELYRDEIRELIGLEASRGGLKTH
ncbi:hypothetical protein C8F01DRAFT_1369303 [Mycena amicta]|nr:hypothetical protein C8F01DRAFT_1369303 [Mycena amicta]